jgi:hypothetical protein
MVTPSSQRIEQVPPAAAEPGERCQSCPQSSELPYCLCPLQGDQGGVRPGKYNTVPAILVLVWAGLGLLVLGAVVLFPFR